MKKTGKLLALLLSLLLILSLCACASDTKYAETEDVRADYSKPEADYKEDYYYEDAVVEEEAMPEMPAEDAGISTSTQGELLVNENPSLAEKIIYSGDVSLETTDFDRTLAALSQAVSQCGGFVQDSNVVGRTRYNSDGTTSVVDRWANYTIRVPSESFESFMAMTNGLGNVLSTNRNAQNVTSQYTDYEARLNSLQIQEERLLEMLEKSSDLDSLITLESRLSEVRYEIEYIERSLRNLDQRIAYSTVYVDVQEVEIITPVTPVTRTFGEKLSDAFRDGWNGFVRGIQNFCLNLAESVPALVILLVGVIVGLIVIQKLRKKKKAAREAAKTEPENKPE